MVHTLYWINSRIFYPAKISRYTVHYKIMCTEYYRYELASHADTYLQISPFNLNAKPDWSNARNRARISSFCLDDKMAIWFFNRYLNGPSNIECKVSIGIL